MSSKLPFSSSSSIQSSTSPSSSSFWSVWKLDKVLLLHTGFGLSLLTINNGGILFASSIIYNTIHRYLLSEHNNKLPQKASAVSLSDVESCIVNIQQLVQLDEGNRGIGDILPPQGSIGSLQKAAECMTESETVAIITGFPCMMDYSPPTETDGPLGALSLARTLLHLGKDVIILTDECNEEVLLACGAASGLMTAPFTTNESKDGRRGRKVLRMESFPPSHEFDVEDELRLNIAIAEVDLVIAIERTGPNIEGRYLTMRGRDMSHLVSPLDKLFPLSKDGPLDGQGESGSATESIASWRTIGIGDGGNEVGMGAVYAAVAGSRRIMNAETIACTVAADHLIVASVSNWGGYALSAATAMLSCYRQNKSTSGLLDLQLLRDHMQMCLPSDEEEIRMCERMVLAGARDGITGENAAKVDGMPLETSLQVLRAVRDLWQ